MYKGIPPRPSHTTLRASRENWPRPPVPPRRGGCLLILGKYSLFIGCRGRYRTIRVRALECYVKYSCGLPRASAAAAAHTGLSCRAPPSRPRGNPCASFHGLVATMWCLLRAQRCSKSRRQYLTLNIVTVLTELSCARIDVIILAINTAKFSVNYFAHH